MKKFVCAIPLMLALAAVSVRAEDKAAAPATPPPVAAPQEVALTGQVFAKKKDAPGDVAANFKADGKTYLLVPKDDDVAKQIKAAMNSKADVKGTIDGDKIHVSSIDKKGGKPPAK